MEISKLYTPDTIVALSTPQGLGAIAVIRLSGSRSIAIVNQFFTSKNLHNQQSHTVVFGNFHDGYKEIIDEVVITKYIAPNSYTSEDVIEISCHASPFIIQKILKVCIEQGARPALPGEFTQRAYLNGKLGLSQAEAVADLIASSSRAAHRLAMDQLKGGFAKKINELRQEMIDLAALVELELDFGEEDVEFADREKLNLLIAKVQKEISPLINSFSIGNAIKEGVPIAIVGRPNTGKSTLLNALLKDDKAIISNIPGTTRDVIEDTFILKGIKVRIMDTAGLRDTDDQIEKIGVQRAIEKMGIARIILYLCSALEKPPLGEENIEEGLQSALHYQDKFGQSEVILIANKYDLVGQDNFSPPNNSIQIIPISASKNINLDILTDYLAEQLDKSIIQQPNSSVIVSNIRHYTALVEAKKHLDSVQDGLNFNLSHDLLALDLRHALQYISEITGEISTDDLLGSIFSRFCIGK